MELLEQTTESRFKIFELLTQACSHFYSKNELQTGKVVTTLESLSSLTWEDPIFLVHLAAWSAGRDNKDFKRTAIYLNSLSSGDGTPFVAGGTERKPNFRRVSQALLPAFNPKELARLAWFKRLKWNNGVLAVHFAPSFRRAIGRYLNSMSRFEVEQSLKSGFREHLIHCYRLLQVAPSNEMVKLLAWNQKDGRRAEKVVKQPLFEGLSDLEVARKIEQEKLNFSLALSSLPGKPSAQVLSALFETASPDQLIVRIKQYEESGLLSVPEFAGRFYAKLETGKAVDRIDRLAEKAGESVKVRLAGSRTKGRQAQFGKLEGRMWLDIDISVSMKEAIDKARLYAANFLDVVGANNFKWGLVGAQGRSIDCKPVSKEQALSALYGVTACDCRSNLLYNYRIVQGGPDPADYWVSFTDGDINYGLESIAHLPVPKTFIIVHLGSRSSALADFLVKNGIRPYYLPASALEESALLAGAIRTAVRGPMEIVDEIMATELPIPIAGYNCRRTDIGLKS